MYLNIEHNGPIEPTPADLAMEKFRKLFPYTKVYVFENSMGYRFQGCRDIQKRKEQAELIIRTANLPLIVSDANQDCIIPTITIKYIAAMDACYSIMQRA